MKPIVELLALSFHLALKARRGMILTRYKPLSEGAIASTESLETSSVGFVLGHALTIRRPRVQISHQASHATFALFSTRSSGVQLVTVSIRPGNVVILALTSRLTPDVVENQVLAQCTWTPRIQRKAFPRVPMIVKLETGSAVARSIAFGVGHEYQTRFAWALSEFFVTLTVLGVFQEPSDTSAFPTSDKDVVGDFSPLGAGSLREFCVAESIARPLSLVGFFTWRVTGSSLHLRQYEQQPEQHSPLLILPAKINEDSMKS